MGLVYVRKSNLADVRQKKVAEKSAKATTTQLLSDLMVESKKKDVLIGQLTQMVNSLNIEISKLKGGTE